MDYNHLFTKESSKTLNKTNLVYIGIFGLFNLYNVEIDFDKQVNIFIGENGLGKTTILNCIYYLLEGKFSKLGSIEFSEIKIQYKNDTKKYTITSADVNDYNRKNMSRSLSYKRYDEMDMYIADIIENIAPDGEFNEIYDDHEIERITYEVSRVLDVPIPIARSRIRRYINYKKTNFNNGKKGSFKNVDDLIKTIKQNISHRIIYLPTYRRIEDDFSTLNIGSNEINRSEVLIKFGMSDVQSAIDRILEKIRTLAMRGFTEMTGVLLKQYTDEKNPIEKMYYNDGLKKIKYETVKIVLDRLGKEIEESYKAKILTLVKSCDIEKNLYLCNLIYKLIDNYELQKKYDDRIKKFTDTCNRYLINKHFFYNQSTLSLDVFLNDNFNENGKVIQLMQLSSGEKQIVSLFSKLYLESDEKSIVVIDEPELSLSIQWQKMLLPDIILTNNCDLLVTVTHSPFIFANEFDYDAKPIRQYIKKYKRG